MIEIKHCMIFFVIKPYSINYRTLFSNLRLFVIEENVIFHFMHLYLSVEIPSKTSSSVHCIS